MKLRIEEDAIGLRLSRAEIAELAEKRSLEVATPLGRGQILRYRLEAADVQALELSWSDGALTVRLPARDAAEWPRSGQIGFSRELDAGEGRTTSLRVEWDFKGEQRPDRKARRQEAMEEAYAALERDEVEDRSAAREEPSD